MLEGLPPDSTSQQNAAIITYPHSRAWPLVLDSLGIAQQWLKSRETKAQVIKYQVRVKITKRVACLQLLECSKNTTIVFQDSKLHDALIKALEDGSTVLIDNVSTHELNEDSTLLDILQCRQTLYRSKTIVKTLVGTLTKMLTFILITTFPRLEARRLNAALASNCI